MKQADLSTIITIKDNLVDQYYALRRYVHGTKAATPEFLAAQKNLGLISDSLTDLEQFVNQMAAFPEDCRLGDVVEQNGFDVDYAEASICTTGPYRLEDYFTEKGRQYWADILDLQVSAKPYPRMDDYRIYHFQAELDEKTTDRIDRLSRAMAGYIPESQYNAWFRDPEESAKEQEAADGQACAEASHP